MINSKLSTLLFLILVVFSCLPNSLAEDLRSVSIKFELEKSLATESIASAEEPSVRNIVVRVRANSELAPWIEKNFPPGPSRTHRFQWSKDHYEPRITLATTSDAIYLKADDPDRGIKAEDRLASPIGFDLVVHAPLGFLDPLTRDLRHAEPVLVGMVNPLDPSKPPTAFLSVQDHTLVRVTDETGTVTFENLPTDLAVPFYIEAPFWYGKAELLSDQVEIVRKRRITIPPGQENVEITIKIREITE